jgi:hypothetical protein
MGDVDVPSIPSESIGASILEAIESPAATDSNENSKSIQPFREISDEAKKTIFELHSKGKTPKQITAHYSLSEQNISEEEISNIIKSHLGHSHQTPCCNSDQII